MIEPLGRLTDPGWLRTRSPIGAILNFHNQCTE